MARRFSGVGRFVYRLASRHFPGGSVQTRRVLVALLVLLALIAAACGGRDEDDDAAGSDSETETEDSDAPDADGTDDGEGDEADADTGDTGDGTDEESDVDVCADAELEATETGVTEDAITVVALADVNSPLAEGLFQGAWDGAEAWAEHVNAEGGIACREVDLILADSLLNATETTNGFLQACNEALALVGTTVLFGTGTDDLNNCEDAQGNPIGVPDLAYITTEVPHQCSANSFHVSRPGAACPYEGGPREHTVNVGAVEWIARDSGATFNGIMLVPNDFESTIAATVPQIVGMEEIGVTFDDAVGIGGLATQAELQPVVQTMQEAGSNFAYNGSNDQSMLKLISEAAAQGVDLDSVTWVCSLSCYTPDFLEQGGDDVEGVYTWMSFVPFSEGDANDELADFLEAIDDPFPAAWAAGAWADGVMLENVIESIVERDGPNGITRQAVLDELATLESFDANGWWAPADMTDTNTIAECFAVMQVQDGEFVRVHPEAPGELDCDGNGVVEVTSDPSDFEG